MFRCILIILILSVCFQTKEIDSTFLFFLSSFYSQKINISFPHLHQFLANSLVVWDFSFLSFLIFRPKNIGFSMQETPQFYRFSTVDAPSILHRYSIDGPSFRWRIDGLLMDNRWSILGVLRRNLSVYALRIRNAHQPLGADVRYFQVVITVQFSLFLWKSCLI